MSQHRYNTPEQGTLDWHIPLNENFERLDRDVEVRDLESNLNEYDPVDGAKFLATDTGATYTGDGEQWNLVGYVTRAGGGDFGHYVRYGEGVEGEEINRFFLEDGEKLEVVRISLPVKGLSDSASPGDVRLAVEAGGNTLVSVQGNEFKTSASSDSGPWTTDSSPVQVTVTNGAGEPVEVVPKVWVNLRR